MQTILSIDIGIKNLGYTLLSYSQLPMNISLTSIPQHDFDISFDIFNISDKVKGTDNVVSARCLSLHNFMINLFNSYSISHVIIEKQVPTNTTAMELMYSIYSISLSYLGPDHIVLFDPKLKFVSINEEYSTKNKAHKKQSIGYAYNLLSRVHPSLINQFNEHTKKDDISDSLNQAVIYMLNNSMLTITKHDLRQLYGLTD